MRFSFDPRGEELPPTNRYDAEIPRRDTYALVPRFWRVFLRPSLANEITGALRLLQETDFAAAHGDMPALSRYDFFFVLLEIGLFGCAALWRSR